VSATAPAEPVEKREAVQAAVADFNRS
jgi:hypothetical protein